MHWYTGLEAMVRLYSAPTPKHPGDTTMTTRTTEKQRMASTAGFKK